MPDSSERPWLPFYSSGIPSSLDYPDIPLHSLLTRSAERFPDRTAILYQRDDAAPSATLTYRELDRLSGRFAAGLAAMEVGRGDRVAYFLQNCPELVIAFYGILKAGAVPAPCNPMYTGDELLRQLDDAQAHLIVCDHDTYPLARRVLDATSTPGIVVVGGEGPAPSFEGILESQGEPLPPVPIDPVRDLALLPYTGGTTGVSKGAMLTHRNMVVNAMQFAAWYGYEAGKETFISTLPLFHIGGIAGAMSVPISVGATMLLFRRFDARRVLTAIQEHRATRFPAVPTMYIAALDLEGADAFDLTSLRPSRTSASSLPPAVKRSFDGLAGHEVLIEGYGLTETSPLTHANPIHRAKEGSIGVPLPDTDARIVDAEEGVEEVAQGEIGELVIRGPQVMAGYWKKLQDTADVLRDGWLYTGDLARMDDEGYFYIVDRKKDVINAAGFKVWPREVEEVLFEHRMVEMAAVVGVADRYRGETVKAVLVLRKEFRGRPVGEVQEELLKHCRSKLAAYKVPRLLEVRDSLPVSAAGKVLRRELKG